MDWKLGLIGAIGFGAYFSIRELVNLLKVVADRLERTANASYEIKSFLNEHLPSIAKDADRLTAIERHTQRAVVDKYERDAFERMHLALQGKSGHVSDVSENS